MSTQDNRASAAGNRRSKRSEEHQVMEHSRSGRSRRTLRFLGTWVASALLVSTQLALPVAAAPVAPAAPAPQAAPAAPTADHDPRLRGPHRAGRRHRAGHRG